MTKKSPKDESCIRDRMAVAATSCGMVVVTLTFCLGYRAGLEASAGYYAKNVSPLARYFLLLRQKKAIQSKKVQEALSNSRRLARRVNYMDVIHKRRPQVAAKA
ncbi:hypothetical protein, partial [Rheinheimera faecalis]|uniref:hypothetical protein n=1 Tax=Rheinheimera faecalis TaxID=2901141 RepID=UPI001E5CD2DF